MTITLAVDAALVGIEAGGHNSPTETVRFYDASNTLLGTVSLSGPGLTFAGWQSDGALIHSIQIQDTAENGQIMMMDNLIYQVAPEVAAPEPASLAVLGLGVAAAIGTRRRRR